MRLINADELLAEYDRVHVGKPGRARALIENASTVERFEIIHCQRCKHWKNKHLCEALSRYGTFETPEDFYCGYAERSEQE